jgi:hypothetical protein
MLLLLPCMLPWLLLLGRMATLATDLWCRQHPLLLLPLLLLVPL